MVHDPFEQFERSRGGLLIPVALFVIGALMTTVAVRALDDIVSVTVEDVEADVAPVPEPAALPGQVPAPVLLESPGPLESPQPLDSSLPLDSPEQQEAPARDQPE